MSVFLINVSILKLFSKFNFLPETRVCVCLFSPLTFVGVCRRGAVRLGMSKVTQVDFVPREMVSYSKETQTPTETVTTHTEQKAGETHTDTERMISQPFA